VQAVQAASALVIDANFPASGGRSRGKLLHLVVNRFYAIFT
jgi:hypothetical protein